MKSFLLILSIVPFLVINCVGISLKIAKTTTTTTNKEDNEDNVINSLNKNTRAAVLEDRRFASCN